MTLNGKYAIYTVRDFRNILKHNGYTKERNTGDHEVWCKEGLPHISIPNKSKTLNPMITRRLIKENNLKV